MKDRRQIGAIAYSHSVETGLRILLVTSRDTGRWVIPKGWPMKSKLPHKAVAQEAFEEAGVEGSIAKKPAGTYRYPKTLRNGDVVSCRVKVYPMEVKKLAAKWPEAGERKRQWFSTEDAAAAVVEPELAEIFRSIGQIVS
jgi:8-oxo-dGTP pyrophosphatase MutT (NUDIX family)